MCTTQKFFLFCFVLICNSSVLAEADGLKVTTADLVQCSQFVIHVQYKRMQLDKFPTSTLLNRLYKQFNSQSITLATFLNFKKYH